MKKGKEYSKGKDKKRITKYLRQLIKKYVDDIKNVSTLDEIEEYVRAIWINPDRSEKPYDDMQVIIKKKGGICNE